MSKVLDNSEPIGYNKSNDVNEEGSDEGRVDIIRMDEQEPVNDTECTHEKLIKNPEDTIGDAVYHGCANDKCGLGWYIRAESNKNTKQ